VAQLVLTLAGGVLGGGIAGGLGQSLGALFGAYVGGILDRELFGPQQDRRTVEGTRLTELNLSGSAYGQTMPVVWGRMRVPANIIWVRGIREIVRTETETVGGGGKGSAGGGGGTQTITHTSYHYYADVALGVCEAPITSIYRIWLDKMPLDPEHVDDIRTYYGDETQSPDPLIQAVEGAARTPAFRGLSYVVLENLYLTPYGNRFPNFEIEVYRGSDADVADARHLVRSVCVMPASGEWAYEPDVVRSRVRDSNINSNTGRKAADFTVSIDNLRREVSNVEWISLVYAWFGTSLDAATCAIRPAAEYAITPDRLPDTAPYSWSVMGSGRPVIGWPGGWPLVSSYTRPDGSTGLSYGGTISDGSIVRAIRHLHSLGYKVMLYPFLMMDIPPPAASPFPWRGRIAGAAADVPGFFERNDGYLRFIRHCMALAEQAGGVDSFVIGSELVALNRIRDGAGGYPAVPFWRQIASEAKIRLGPRCIVTYAADWSEYRYHDRGGANVDFPLDALWADPNIDVVGIDAYFPLTDRPRAVYDKAAIAAGWASGELIDYYYATQDDRDLGRRGLDQRRMPIDDPFWMIKNIRWWWENEHGPRVGGVPTGPATGWVPRGKPIWFTEYGFPTVNCATNQPNVFIDPKSIESFAPYYSNRAVDRVVQRVAIEATEQFWSDPANNPTSPLYDGPMVDRRFVWCWDARPYPFFPTLTKVWSDGENFRLGHWIEGKIGNMQLAGIVRDLCLRAGLAASEFDVTALDDEVVGYVVTERKPVRDMIAVLQTAYFFDAVERDGVLVFVKRGAGSPITIDPNDLGASENDSDRSRVKVERTQDTELPIAVDIVHLDEGRDYQSSTVTVRKQVGQSESVNTLSLPVVLTVEQAQEIGQRALREMWQGREAVDLRLPTRAIRCDPTDIVAVPIDGVWRRIRLTAVTYGKPGLVLLRGVATDGGVPEFYTAPTGSGVLPPSAPEPVAPVRVELLDMPIMIDNHDASASSFYVAAYPVGIGRFRGATLFQPTADALDYTVAAAASLPSIIGTTVTELAPGPAWRWDRANAVEVQLDYGALQSLADERVLAGGNAALIDDEVIQFASAELIAEGRYRLSRLLRGQRGTEHEIAAHPAGSRFILLDPARQPRPNVSVSRIGIEITWRTAPVPQGPSGDLSGEIVFTDSGKGLRPFAPAHPRATRERASGDIQLSWIRRTRIGGDSWLNEVPLGEETEEYNVQILDGANVVRPLRVAGPSALYTAVQQMTDFGVLPASLAWRVAQVSRVLGPGASTEVTSTF
jgi:hypothetical protein